MSESDFALGFKQGRAVEHAVMLEMIEDIKTEIGARVFDIQATSDKYFDGVDDVMDIVDEIIDRHIGKAESEDT